MNDQQREILQTLRNAAKQDQWNLCDESVAQLLSDLTGIDAITIIVRQAHRFLGDLFQMHPDDESLRRVLEALNDITSLEALNLHGQLINPLLDTYWNWPGVSNFRNALKGISKPEQYFDHSDNPIETMVSVLSRILTAIVMNNYWGSNPAFSATFFGKDVRKAVLMLGNHHSDPKQIELRASVWSEIADELEKALHTT
jgi:hypothetical protein